MKLFLKFCGVLSCRHFHIASSNVGKPTLIKETSRKLHFQERNTLKVTISTQSNIFYSCIELGEKCFKNKAKLFLFVDCISFLWPLQAS